MTTNGFITAKRFIADYLGTLWRAMGATGEGYRRHCLRNTGKRSEDKRTGKVTWDRRGDKPQGCIRFDKYMRSYRKAYA